jgi:hypothetical protein
MWLCRHNRPRLLAFTLLLVSGALRVAAEAQTDCAEGNSPLDSTSPNNITQEVIQKLGAQESRVKQARSHYTYNQDVMVQTLSGNDIDGQFHQVSTISYDDEGARVESVTFAEQSTLRDIQLSAEDMDDIREFMPLVLSTSELAKYNLTFSGQQHVDDLDTYVFHVDPKTQEKGKRYFQGRIWVDNRDLQVVKLCGKSVPDAIVPKKKKNQPQEIRPIFVGYRQYVDGLWFPAYARVDDTLHFRVDAVHVREIVKFTGYKLKSSPSPPH